MKRLILVAAEDERELQQAIRAFRNGVIGAVGRDIYDHIKQHLRQRNVTHHDRHMHPRDVPPGYVYYSE